MSGRKRVKFDDTPVRHDDRPVEMCLLISINGRRLDAEVYRKRKSHLGALEKTLLDDLDNSGELFIALMETNEFDDEYDKKRLAYQYAKYKKIPVPENFLEMTPLNEVDAAELKIWRDACYGWECGFIEPPTFTGKVVYDTKIYYHKLRI